MPFSFFSRSRCPTQVQDHDLFIALHARTSNTHRTYHWALLICAVGSPPTALTGTRYHASNSAQGPTLENPNPLHPGPDGRFPWRFEAGAMAEQRTAAPLLARVRVGRVKGSVQEVAKVLESVPLVQGDRAWNCVTWVRDAMAHLVKREMIDLPARGEGPVLEVVTTTEEKRLTLSDEVWDWVQRECLGFLERKHEIHRWSDAPQGRWVEGEVPTWALVVGKEVVA